MAESTEAAAGATRKAVDRSPAYPSLDLRTAIDRARTFYEQEKFNYAATAVAQAHWGYAPKSGSGMRVTAALIQYGLLEDEGSGEARRVRLSERAKDILLDEREGSRERLLAIRAAALKPKIYELLWKAWGPTLPSDQAMAYDLARKWSFNPTAIPGFIKGFRATMEFAKVPDAAILEDEARDDEVEDGPEGPEPPPKPPVEGSAMPDIQRSDARLWDLTIPLVGGGQAILRTPIPLSEEDFELLTTMLQANLMGMKRAITGAPTAATSGEV